ncbi:MAG: FMN-binding protein [Alloprevotella sp.]|nr:FMN-binding protein [Alloprevotella sp.]
MKQLFTLIFLALAMVSTRPAFAQNQNRPTAQKADVVSTPNERQLEKLGLKDARLKEIRTGIWAVSQGNKKKGFVLNSAEFSKEVVGYHGNTPLLVYIDGSKKVASLLSLRNRETPSYYNRAETLLKNWKGKSVKEAKKARVDAVSGATYSSDAIIQNVKATLEAYNKYCK